MVVGLCSEQEGSADAVLVLTSDPFRKSNYSEADCKWWQHHVSEITVACKLQIHLFEFVKHVKKSERKESHITCCGLHVANSAKQKKIDIWPFSGIKMYRGLKKIPEIVICDVLYVMGFILPYLEFYKCAPDKVVVILVFSQSNVSLN